MLESTDPPGFIWVMENPGVHEILEFHFPGLGCHGKLNGK